MGIRCRHLSEAGRGRREPERRSKNASQSFTPGTFSLGGLTPKAFASLPAWTHFLIALRTERAQTAHMKTTTRLRCLRGWSVRCACIAILLASFAPAFADPSKNVVTSAREQSAPKRVQKVCYVMSSVSGIPQPCDRFGGIPTTTSPILIIGHTTAR